jgi:hypothetical protein
MNLQNSLHTFINDPYNALNSFQLGYLYEKQGQTASAAGYYVRTTEFGNDKLLIYEALLRLALCLERQGSRVFTTKGVLLRAVSLLPDRPEAYFLLTRLYERSKDWQEAYTWAVLGEEKFDVSHSPAYKLKTNIEYPGEYGFTFERAVAAWWIGLWDEAIFLLRLLKKNPVLDPIYASAIENNLQRLANDNKKPLEYRDEYYEQLRVKFNNAAHIKKNFSQCYQDMFVLTMLNGKTNGRYLEVGCGDPFYGNNTALLETEFYWSGISIDINPVSVNMFQQKRKNKVMLGDATKIDYKKILDDGIYDYLQVDCDPPEVSFQILLKIPFEKTPFRVITFEHDHYVSEESGIRDKSRAFLKSLGYQLVVTDIAPDKFNSFEDWWVHPDLVDKNIITRMQNLSGEPKRADDYMLNKLY